MKKLIDKNFNPDKIREATLKKMEPHISRMKDLISEIFMFYGKTDFNIEKFWRDKYINKMLKMSQKFPESLKEELV